MMRRGFAAGLALAMACVVGPALAQDPPLTVDSAAEARQQYQEGSKAFSAKRYSEAAMHFEAAASFKANAVVLYTAGLAWDLASRPERAADAYARSLEVAGLDAKQTSVSKDRVATLEKTLGTVTVTAPEGWRVQLDTLTEVPTPARLHGSPGIHVLNIRLPNKTIERRDVTLEAGRTIPIELKEEAKKPVKLEPEPEPVKEKAPPPPPEPLPPRLREGFWTTPKVIGVGVAGVGLATVLAGAILGSNALDAKDAYDAAPSRAGFDHASSLETWTNVAFVGGLVLLAGGIVLVAVPIGERNEGKLRASITNGGLRLGGTF